MANGLKTRANGPGFKAVKGGLRCGAGQNTKLMPRQTMEWAWVWVVT